jgi:hypothetical protein
MTDKPRPDLDRRLREAFAADPAAVTRVAAGAEARSRRESTSPRAALRARFATLCVTGGAIIAVVMLLLESRVPRPAAEPEPATASLSGSFTDGLLVVSLPDGSVAITGGEARRDRPQDGYGFVLVEGELR